MMQHANELWTRFTRDADRQARERLILHYSPLVKYVVSRMSLGLPRSLEPGDLVSYGVIGLIKAIDNFDPGRGTKFESYAVTRIRGQIIDSLRALDPLPRSTYRQARQIEAAIGELCQHLGRNPSDEEVAAHLGIHLGQYHKWLVDANCVIISLDQPWTNREGDQYSLYDSLEDHTMPTPSEQVDHRETKDQMIDAIRTLSEREQLMISLYYNDRLSMKEIGQVLGVSESRVSQMHARAILTLRGLMKGTTPAASANYNREGVNAGLYAAAR